MKGCLRVYTCSVCGHMLIIQDGKRANEPCDCMIERAAIKAEAKEAAAHPSPASDRTY